MMRTLVAAMLTVLVAACASGPASLFQSKGEQALAAGLKQYDAGDYPAAQKSLQGALEVRLVGFSHLRTNVVQVRRHAGEQQIIIRVKVLVRLAKRESLEIGHPAVISQPLCLHPEPSHQRMISPQPVQRRLGNLRMRPPGFSRPCQQNHTKHDACPLWKHALV